LRAGPAFSEFDKPKRRPVMNTKTAILTFNRLTGWTVTLALLITLVVGPVSASVSSAGLESFIVQGADSHTVTRLVESYGGTVTSQLDLINGVGALLSPSVISRLLAEPGITSITPNAEVKLVGGAVDPNPSSNSEEGGLGPKSPATDYPDVIGANVVWGQGVNGSGVTVAVVDTGLGLHQGITKDVNNRDGRILDWVDFVEGKRSPSDPNGHGTHIAGVIANSQIGEDGEWNGVAPGVNLVGVRVLDETGAGTYEHVIQGIQWVINNQAKYNIRVMNLSLVSPVQSAYWADPLNQAVMQAWAKGIVVVAAAGNDGPNPMTIGTPGNNPYVITVGAFTDKYTPSNWSDDYLAFFSAAGPTLDGFVKPDVVAPGAHIVSTMLPNSYLARNHQANRAANQYFTMAGTSQSAAVVSGLAALVLARNPALTPDQVKYRITTTAFPWIDTGTTTALYSMWQQGAGRVNAPDAVFAAIEGQANSGLDIAADLAGQRHYEGFSYYDETTGGFALRGDFSNWAGGYGTWSGGYGTWSGGYGTWSGGYGTWSGGYETWSGGYGTWSGGYGTWSGGYAPWAGSYGTAAFASRFAGGAGLDAASASATINLWVDEP
jgi:serine protease AprX